MCSSGAMLPRQYSGVGYLDSYLIKMTDWCWSIFTFLLLFDNEKTWSFEWEDYGKGSGYRIESIPVSFSSETASRRFINDISYAYKWTPTLSVKHFQNHFSHIWLVKVFETENKKVFHRDRNYPNVMKGDTETIKIWEGVELLRGNNRNVNELLGNNINHN